MGKQHMVCGRTGRVIKSTPKVPPTDKKKKKTGRAKNRQKCHKNHMLRSKTSHENNVHEFVDLVGFLNSTQRDPRSDNQKEWIVTNSQTLVPVVILDNEPSREFDKETLMEMLKREDDIRKSDEIQERYTLLLSVKGFDIFSIDLDIQKQVLRDFGFNPDIDDSLQCYQYSCGLYLDDIHVKECVVWMKYDNMKVCKLRPGDLYIDCSLVRLDNVELKLSDFMTPSVPLVVIGGSYT